MKKAYDKTLGNVEFKSSLFLNKFDILGEGITYNDKHNTTRDNKYANKHTNDNTSQNNNKFTNTLQFVQIVNSVTDDADWLLRKVLKYADIKDELKDWQNTIYHQKYVSLQSEIYKFKLQTYTDLSIAIENLPNEVVIVEHNYDKNTSDVIKKWYNYINTDIGTFRSEFEIKKALKEHKYIEVSSINIIESNPLGIWISHYRHAL